MSLSQKAAEASYLAEIEEKIGEVTSVHEGESLPHSAEVLNAAAKHLCVSESAKRARPLLTLFFGQSLGVEGKLLVNAGVAAELIHSASLLHDDVIDEASVRRGRPTVNVQLGNRVAVLGGNYLLSSAFALLKDYPRETTKEAVDVIQAMTKAAIAEIEVRGRLDIGFDTWREIAIGKTGELFAWCGQAAAMIAGSADRVAGFAEIGRRIGAIFQMVDDVRDLKDSSGLKDKFADIRNKEPSYPILAAVTKSKELFEDFRRAWQVEMLEEKEVERLGQLVLNMGAAQATCEAIDIELHQVLKSLGELTKTEGGAKLVHWLQVLCENAKNGFADISM